MLGARQSHLGLAIEFGDESGQGSLEYLGIGVDEEDVAGVGGLEAAIVGVTEAQVLAAQGAHPGEMLLDVLGRAVAAVIDDDHVELDLAHVLEKADQGRFEPVPAVVGDDDRADVVHNRSTATGRSSFRRRPLAPASRATMRPLMSPQPRSNQ